MNTSSVWLRSYRAVLIACAPQLLASKEYHPTSLPTEACVSSMWCSPEIQVSIGIGSFISEASCYIWPFLKRITKRAL